VGFVVDKVALGQVFSEYFGFPCQSSFHQMLHNHHLSSGAGTIGQTVADVPSGISLTPPRETKKKLVTWLFNAEKLEAFWSVCTAVSEISLWFHVRERSQNTGTLSPLYKSVYIGRHGGN
jgi:hypothetical protein